MQDFALGGFGGARADIRAAGFPEQREGPVKTQRAGAAAVVLAPGEPAFQKQAQGADNLTGAPRFA